jgi:hypothetical protein
MIPYDLVGGYQLFEGATNLIEYSQEYFPWNLVKITDVSANISGGKKTSVHFLTNWITVR